MPTSFGPLLDEVIRRLGAIDRARPEFDSRRAEAALREHFRRLGVEPLPVRWVNDAEQGLSAAWSAAWSAAESAAESAAWSAARDGWVGIWLPFVDAAEAGLWIFWVLEREVIAVPRPALLIEDERLHCADGPAVAWPNGARYWFWHGVQVTQQIVERPETLNPMEIVHHQNAEVRRVMMERFGYDRLIQTVGGKVIHADLDGRREERQLVQLRLEGDEPLTMLRVVNASPEPDGHYKRYLLPVPPDARTAYSARCWRDLWQREPPSKLPPWDCQAAVAWTFGLLPSEYDPVLET